MPISSGELLDENNGEEGTSNHSERSTRDLKAKFQIIQWTSTLVT